MSLKFPKFKKSALAAFFLSLILLLGISIGYLTNHVFSENAKFEKFTEALFQKELSGSALTFHYSLAHPEKLGIPRPKATLGAIETDTKKAQKLYTQYESRLKSFDYSRLSTENRLTLDTLLLYCHTQASLGENAILEEVLGPSLGIQAQLPVLLAEYAFYENRDIGDYLTLLSSVRPYFRSILAFEQKKADAGVFMSDATLDRILEQCRAFIKDPDSNYMLEVFAQKLSDYGNFTEAEQEVLNARHKEILTRQVIPAYQELMDGLEALRGRGKNTQGLAHFPGGREYYLYLLKSRVGIYLPIRQIEERLTHQLMADIREISALLQADPSLAERLTTDAAARSIAPGAAMERLQIQMEEDFPSVGKVPYEIRYVHKSMEKFLSPAFYLTPPLDTGSPNVIYLNRSGRTSGLELFTTLGHEGFPGHLYQTVFFGRQNPSHIRFLTDCSGYVEGWATYVESYAYNYASGLFNSNLPRLSNGSPSRLSDGSPEQSLTRLAWLNRSVNLCLYSLIDIGVHYRGWSQAQTAGFLKSFGIRDADAAAQIYQYIVETPANYLKYYLGYLSFLDLKTAQEKKLGEKFDLKDFHRKVLTIGPVPFPVMEKYISQEL